MKKLESRVSSKVLTKFFQQDCLQEMKSLCISDCLAVSDQAVKAIAQRYHNQLVILWCRVRNQY